jgi:hypothetical protein
MNKITFKLPWIKVEKFRHLNNIPATSINKQDGCQYKWGHLFKEDSEPLVSLLSSITFIYSLSFESEKPPGSCPTNRRGLRPPEEPSTEATRLIGINAEN